MAARKKGGRIRGIMNQNQRKQLQALEGRGAAKLKPKKKPAKSYVNMGWPK